MLLQEPYQAAIEQHTEVAGNSSAPCEHLTYNLSHLANQTRLIFNMVPKCGSLGVREVIKQVSYKEHFWFRNAKYRPYKFSVLPQHYPEDQLIRVLNEDLNNHTERFQLYYRHIHFVNFSIVDDSTSYYINVIRDPVEHFISIYYFQKAHPKYTIWGPIGEDRSSRRRRLSSNMTFDECVQSENFQCVDDKYLLLILPFFCGHDEICLTPSKASVEKAKSNVVKYFPVVGYVENLQHFFQLSEAIWPQYFKQASYLYSSRPFKAHKTTQRLESGVRSKQLLAARIPYEYEFYNWIKQRFHCMYSKYVTDKVANFDNNVLNEMH